MSAIQLKICSKIVKECFGEVVDLVSYHLLKHGTSNIRFIAHETGLKIEQVKKSLCILIQHNIVTYEENKKSQIEYFASAEQIVSRIRYPQYIYFVKTLYGDEAELLVEELLENGQLQMSVVIEKVKHRLENDDTAAEKDKVSLAAIKEKFDYLAKTHFIHRCPVAVNALEGEKPPVPSFEINYDDTLYLVPSIDIQFLEKRRKRKLSENENSEQPRKKRKTGEDELPDADIYWVVNQMRLDQYLRDQQMISAVGKKLDKKAAEVLRTMLRLSEVTTNEKSHITNPISYNDVFQAVPRELGLSRSSLDQYLKLLTEDSLDFVIRSGDSGGGMYNINFQKAFHSLAKTHIESVIQERFGSKCLRIFRLLMLKKHLEQKQIEECAMIPAKEAKEMLYAMFSENFIYLTEVPRTPDYAPSRTFYLFSVDLNQVCRMVLQRCYQALYNLILRREHETKDHRRILDKQIRVEAITASLEQQGADEQQKAEVEEMITPSERVQLAKIKHLTTKLEQSELQIDSTISVLKTYLSYEHCAT